MKLVPLRRLLVVGLLLLATVPAVLVAWMLTRSSLQAAEELAGGILSTVAARVQLGTEAHLRRAHDALNGLLPESGTPAQRARARQWLRDPAAFENMAFALTRQTPAVPHVYFGTRHGEFFGVEATPAGARVSVRGTGGGGRTSFDVTRPGERTGAPQVEPDSFEPRVRGWYQGAMQAKDRVFSAVQPLAGSQQLVVTLSQPVYEDDSSAAGVFGVDLHLRELASLLQTQSISARGAAFVIDEAGLLVASSAGDALFREAGGRMERRGPADSANAVIRQSYAGVLAARARQSADTVAVDKSLQRLPMDGDSLMMMQRPFGEALGLRWTLVVAAPESDFTGSIRRSAMVSLAVIAGLVLLAALLAFGGAHGLARRLRRLADAAEQIGRGAVPAIDTDTRILEVRRLSEVLHESAGQLQAYRRQVEADAAALQDANDTLEARVQARTAELAASREEALAAARAKAAFLATMSHEIRTPLNGVVGMSTLLAETPLDAEQRDYLQTIRLSSDQLLSVINDILDFSKIESGKLDLEFEPVSVRAAVEEACDIAAPRARDKGLELIIDIPEAGAQAVPPAILGDVTRIRQVLINLINNAVKFTERGEVAVHVRQLRADDGRGNAELEFRVTDTGIGIPPDRVGALFEAFTQVDASTTRKYGGTGLGLAICKRLVELMGGRLGVESTQGAGSTFWFTIAARPTQLAPAYDPADAGRLQGKRVLVVDDHATNVRVLSRQLELWGLAVVSADSAQAALQWLRGAGELPHAIITDMHMPEMDGVAFARAVKAEPLWQAVPLVLLSSGFMPAGDENARLFMARLLKPARQGQLFDTLLRCLHGEAGPVAAEAGTRERKQRTVLVADDNAVNLKVACAMLFKLGYDVRTATDGREAVEAVAQAVAHGPRLAAILMDVHMPEVDGLQATRQIHAALGPDAPPIIAVTAAASAEDRQRCEAAGMDDYLTKPLQVGALARTLEKWTAPGVQQAAAPAGPTPVPTPADGHPLMDFARLEEFRDYDDEALTMTREVAGLFLADAPQRIAAIVAAVAAHDAAALATAAHALKGSAGNVGASAMHLVAGTLEELATAGLPADAQAHAVQLQGLWQRTEAALQAWLAQLPK